MDAWDERIHEEHRLLEIQLHALGAALSSDRAEKRDLAVAQRWIMREFWNVFELHLRAVERALLPPMKQLLGPNAAGIAVAKAEHGNLRRAFRHFAEVFSGPDREDLNNALEMAFDALAEAFEDHEKEEERLVLDVLRYDLEPGQLRNLAAAFERAEEEAYELEGWPRSSWSERTIPEAKTETAGRAAR